MINQMVMINKLFFMKTVARVRGVMELFFVSLRLCEARSNLQDETKKAGMETRPERARRHDEAN